MFGQRQPAGLDDAIQGLGAQADEGRAELIPAAVAEDEEAGGVGEALAPVPEGGFPFVAGEVRGDGGGCGLGGGSVRGGGRGSLAREEAEARLGGSGGFRLGSWR